MFRSNILSTIIENSKRFITLEVFKGDNHKAKQYNPGGVDYNPTENTEALIIPINSNNADNAVIGYRDEIAPIADSGEKKSYSTNSDGSAIKAYVFYRNSGNLEVNGNADFAVRFNALQTAFDQLKSDFNTQITVYNALVVAYNALVVSYNSHTHASSVPIPLIPGAPGSPGIPSIADITPAKVDTVLLP